MMNLSLIDHRFKQTELLLHETFLRNKAVSEKRKTENNHWIGSKEYLNICAKYPNAVILIEQIPDHSIQLKESIIGFDSDEGLFHYATPIKHIIANPQFIILKTTFNDLDLSQVSLTESFKVTGDDILKKSADLVISMMNNNYPLYNENVENVYFDNHAWKSCHPSQRLTELFSSYTKSNNRLHFSLHLVSSHY